MKKVKDIIDTKGGETWSVDPASSALDAARLMAEKGVGALLVMDEGRVAGLVSERDFSRKLIPSGQAAQDVQVGSIMSTPVVCVRPDQAVDECMALMTDKRVRHLPVLDGERIVGVVSIGDAVKSIIDEQQFTIAQLENYIAG